MPRRNDDQGELLFSYNLYGGTPPHQSHSPTSEAAAEKIMPHVGRLHRRVLDYLRENPRGASDDKMSRNLDMGLNTLRPRRRELQMGGLVVDSGRKELTSTGNPAVIWVLAPASPR